MKDIRLMKHFRFPSSKKIMEEPKPRKSSGTGRENDRLVPQVNVFAL
jgi:hypothetical protein